MMKETIGSAAGVPLTYVLYQDGVVPGNPFRPDKARKVEAWYWAFVDWPDHMLHRSGAWPIFCLVRTKVCDAIPGGVSKISALMLKRFASMTDGVLLPHKSGSFVMRLEFNGFIANLAQFTAAADPDELSLSCPDISQLI